MIKKAKPKNFLDKSPITVYDKNQSCHICGRQLKKGEEKEEYTHTPAREDFPAAERISEEGCVEGSFGAGELKLQ